MAEKKQKTKSASKKAPASATKRTASKTTARATKAQGARTAGRSATKKTTTTAKKAAPPKAVAKKASKPAAKTAAKKPATKSVAKKTVKKAAAASKTAAKAKATATKKASVKEAMKAAQAKLAAASAAKAKSNTRATAAKTKTAAAKTAAPKAAAKTSATAKKNVAAKAATQKAAAAPAAPVASDKKKKPANQRHGFKINEHVVYPAHGVGKIIGIEEQEIAGMALELFVINFEKEKLTLRVPTGKLESVGMRKLADEALVAKGMQVLKGRARVKRTMWSRRAQEYIAKINSGDLISIAEVVRDLYRSEAQPEQSYSERQLYEDALDRMARELAAVEKLDERGAVQRIVEVLSKSARGRRMAEEEAQATEASEASAA